MSTGPIRKPGDPDPAEPLVVDQDLDAGVEPGAALEEPIIDLFEMGPTPPPIDLFNALWVRVYLSRDMLWRRVPDEALVTRTSEAMIAVIAGAMVYLEAENAAAALTQLEGHIPFWIRSALLVHLLFTHHVEIAHLEELEANSYYWFLLLVYLIKNNPTAEDQQDTLRNILDLHIAHFESINAASGDRYHATLKPFDPHKDSFATLSRADMAALYPHRVLRRAPVNVTTMAQVAEEWRDQITEVKIREGDARLKALSPEARRAEELRFFNGGDRSTLVTDTQWVSHAIFYEQLAEFLSGLGRQRHVASFGGGYHDFRNVNVFTGPIRNAFRSEQQSVSGVTVEPYNLLAHLVPGKQTGIIHVVDREPLVGKAVRENRFFPFPLYDLHGQPLQDESLAFAQATARALGHSVGKIVKDPTGAALYLIPISDRDRKKFRFYPRDLALDLLPRMSFSGLQASLYLQTSYFMDLLHQRVAFLKIVDQMAVDGYLVSDFLLSNPEAHALGLNIVDYAGGRSSLSQIDLDGYFFIYQKRRSSPLAEDLYAEVEKAQKVTNPSGGKSGGKTQATNSRGSSQGRLRTQSISDESSKPSVSQLLDEARELAPDLVEEYDFLREDPEIDVFQLEQAFMQALAARREGHEISLEEALGFDEEGPKSAKALSHGAYGVYSVKPIGVTPVLSSNFL
ncbi:MAG: hypothetical protein A3G32_05170 [Deltaproteobacteria bacterium RIFCSPLOWO2_12_FULL_40_28]|nr:MAG: hypothetical protein A3C45_09280 [Deltaproteobacteria bacterium RIFCSPHIGHO2_02_FULL_40_28]OGQ19752.1 MAG: hypothetical protein A3E27_08475 [Deltaproteobacteria bacterium RIFCSPHIGHO2_12_FULL_40_32]OGQ41029.1 MAG: hypothetical protein A3I69_03890 [Deltaproteobacteria bacterium RIFCSPLOWO2_02_FULL_40_36]OGQ54145.1 MAG: hypothetical protein A3G32_05170 [Deltaproteobacteria bacterium RIFCSPLOWO2_12_FULL_40_28]